MKKIITLSLLCLFYIFNGNAQCTSGATAFGNNTSIPMYNVTGMVSVVLNTNNTVTVNLGSNFATAAGPDVRVFLVDRGTLTNAQLRVTTNFLARPKIEMGVINANGTASYTKAIPSDINISSFNTVYFYCQNFNQFWDFGSYNSFTNTNCTVLSNENFVSNRVKVYPNPSKGSITIAFDALDKIKSFHVYSILGQKVFASNEVIASNTSIIITSLKTGIYFLELIDDKNNTILKKISVQN